ncbi:MAG: universal stress protein [Desulfobacterales bacterium]
MATQKILLPYNFTPLDGRALKFVSEAFAHNREAEVTLFHVYPPPPRVETMDSLVTVKLKGSLAQISQQVAQLESRLEEVRGMLTERGFTPERVKVVFAPRRKDIAEEIIELVARGHFDVVVLNRRAGRVTRFFSGSVSQKVLAALSDTTVCIVC